MNNNTLQIKFKQRLNKIDSQDYDNIQAWEIAESYNKAQVEWCRRQLSGTNIRKEGDEMTKRRIDDLSILLTTKALTGMDFAYNETFGYFQSDNFAQIYDPNIGGNYLEFKRVECAAQQCFPYVPSSSVTTLVNNTGTVPGYIQYNWELIETPGGSTSSTEIIDHVPIFTWNTLSQPAITLPMNVGSIFAPTNNIVTSWGPFEGPSGIIPGGGPVTGIITQEPWAYNQNVVGVDGNTLPPGVLNIDPILWFDSNAGANIPNMQVIPPVGYNSAALNFGCDLCGLTAEQIGNSEELSELFCNGFTTGYNSYYAGGPNNQLISCTNYAETGQIVISDIPDLLSMSGELEGGSAFGTAYSYTNTPNTWVTTVGESVYYNEIWNETEITGIDGQLYTPTACLSNGCWFKPANVVDGTWSVTNWVTEPSSWAYEYTETEIGPTTINYTTEETTEIPFTQCYCAPGADKESFCTKARTMTVYQSEVGNIDVILRDPLKRPDFEWAETFCTLQADGTTPNIRIWRRNFHVMDPKLVYYRMPRRIEILNSVDPYTGLIVALDITPEFKDDIVELIIDSAVSILAGDISDANQMMRGEQSSEKNN